MHTMTALLGIDAWLRSLWLKPGNSDLAPDVDGLFMFILWVCIISFILLMIPMFYWSFRYRRRPGVAQQRTPNHNTLLEIAWVGGPLIIVVFIFFWGFHGYMKGQVAYANAETINVSGVRWAWEVTYKNGANPQETVFFDDATGPAVDLKAGEVHRRVRGNKEFPIVVVPAGRPVKFLLTSRDVLHSFYLPDQRIKMDVIPNRFTSLTFIAPDFEGPSQAGAYHQDSTRAFSNQFPHRDHFIFCAEYCGQDHAEMAGVLRVMRDADYEKTIAEWGNLEPRLPYWEIGAVIHRLQCASCHTVTGSGGSAPSWKGFYGKPVPFDREEPGAPPIDWNAPDAWDNYIVESILYPARRIHAGYPNQMNAFQLTDRQMRGVIAYFRKLNGVDRPEDNISPEQEEALREQGQTPSTPPSPQN